jgi:hypothetical protein
MNRITDYTTYINALKFNTGVNKTLVKLGNVINILENKYNNNNITSEIIYVNSGNNLITSDIESTFISPQLDVSPNGIRFFYLQANPNILNGTKKFIINNVDVSSNIIIKLYCINSDNEGGFYALNHKYSIYTFSIKGEILELLWNSSLNVWNVLKYDSLFSNIS